jgi:hypothetical protein
MAWARTMVSPNAWMRRTRNAFVSIVRSGSARLGPVAPDEKLYRLLVSPGDVDEDTGEIAETAFSKVAKSGLSVFRECASDDDVTALVEDRLSVLAGRKPRKVLAVLELVCHSIRDIKSGDGQRLFCVYDETVPRHSRRLTREFRPTSASTRSPRQKGWMIASDSSRTLPAL